MIISGLLHSALYDSLSLLCTLLSNQRGIERGLSILRMELLGGEQDRCCRNQGLEVHIATRAKLFGSGRAAAPRRVAVHAGTLATCHFPTVGGRMGEE